MSKKTILITGCSSGIGLETAIALNKRGHRVIASCRQEKDLAKLKALNIEVVQLDVDNSESIQQAVAQVISMTNNHLDVLINNAGFGQIGALEDITRDDIRAQFETNVFGLLELTNLIIPIMRQQNSGRIINVSSLLGIISMPFRGAYNASKYAVEGICDTLRLELKPSGIRVITVEPGPIVSHFRGNAREHFLARFDWKNSAYQAQYASMLKNFLNNDSTDPFIKTPNAVVKAFIHAIESDHPKIKYPITLPAHLFIMLKRFFCTKLLDNLLLYISKKELR